jgi:hypothetical protein
MISYLALIIKNVCHVVVTDDGLKHLNVVRTAISSFLFSFFIKLVLFVSLMRSKLA